MWVFFIMFWQKQTAVLGMTPDHFNHSYKGKMLTRRNVDKDSLYSPGVCKNVCAAKAQPTSNAENLWPLPPSPCTRPQDTKKSLTESVGELLGQLWAMCGWYLVTNLHSCQTERGPCVCRFAASWEKFGSINQ